MSEISAFPMLDPDHRIRSWPSVQDVARNAVSELDTFPHVPFPEQRDEPAFPMFSPGLAAVWAKPRPEAAQPSRTRFPVGMRALDDYLGGGLQAGASLAVIGPPFGGKRTLACHFLASGVTGGNPALALLTDGDVSQWRQAVAGLSARVPDDKKGLACFLDLCATASARPGTEAMPLPELILAAVANACEAMPTDRRHFVFDSFTTVAALCGFAPAFSMLMRLTAMLRREGATCLFLVEAGAHTPMELQLIKRQADGAIEFRQYGGTPELQVTGLGMPGPSPWLQGRSETGPVQMPVRGV